MTKAISFLVFSMMTTGSLAGQRRKLGANTIERLEASILVTATTSGVEKSCRNLNMILIIKVKITEVLLTLLTVMTTRMLLAVMMTVMMTEIMIDSDDDEEMKMLLQ